LRSGSQPEFLAITESKRLAAEFYFIRRADIMAHKKMILKITAGI